MNKLVLIGGGHSHVVALKFWHQKPLSNIEIILISNVEKTPYSGMLPAHFAHYYTLDQIHINLVKLSTKYGINFILDTVINIDTKNQQIICQSGNIFNYDLLSIDIGCTPQKNLIIGAEKYTIPVKPVPQLLAKWQEIQNFCQTNPLQNQTINIIGGGAGGVELALSIHDYLSSFITPNNLNINIITKSNILLKNTSKYASQKLIKICEQKNINLYFNQKVKEITANYLITESEAIIGGNYHFLVTDGRGALWLQRSNLSTDEKDFILIKKTLQSVSHDNIFASGDIATMTDYPTIPKAGVFAVRQGKPLAENWRRWLQNQPLQNYYPQSLHLSLIGVGGGRALMIWGDLVLESSLCWQWKNYLDQRFMAKYGQ